MFTFGKLGAVLLWLPIIIWVGISSVWENWRGIPPTQPFSAGVTFSSIQAERLGLDGNETYLAILDDLGIRRLRLAAYWSEIEKEPEVYDFSSLDFQISEAEKRNAKVILAVGLKLPRWPECHAPDWTKGILSPERDVRLDEFISRTVLRYRNSPAVRMWQVENEPFFPFGQCPKISKERVRKEIDLVRVLSDKPIVITDSGELSNWFDAARFGDVVGTTMFRRNLTRFGYFNYPLPALYYEKKAKLIKRFFGDDVFVSEMQAEPWMRSPYLANFPLAEQFKGLDFTRFQEHIAYAKASRLTPVYFWGVEWWYWLKTQEHPEFWEYARDNIVTEKVEEIFEEPLVTPSPPPPPLFDTNLKPGMQSDEVRRLQEVLRSLGFFPEDAPLSGIFGPITEQAVRGFQESHGIEPLGIFGPKTREALNDILQEQF